ncbi:MAG: bifunctional riboflavin kinase/FAD synthetase [Verrucomicrobiae bacterium]|nr:bifunctional riboflavin kinase/FAD synthetase [Verrucomicrobiae bacterium]
MKVVRSFAELSVIADKIGIAIGVFDGVHLGHQSVIRAALDDAAAVNGTAVVLTFDPHPMRVLAPDKAPPLLTSTQHKLALIESLGVPVCLMIPFTIDFARTEPDPFLSLVFQSAKNLKSICVGHAFRFGHDRKGNVQTILAFGRERGVRVDVMPPVTSHGETISSTTIRKAVAAGDLAKAERMTGRPFSVLGTVEAGDQIGRKLGYPTANLNPHNEVLPPNGVYAVCALHETRKLTGIVNIGVRPTIVERVADRRFELHILDFAGDLYGKTIEVSFVHKLRDEQKFDSPERLKAQIARDEAEARRMFAG